MSEYKLKCNNCNMEQTVDVDESVPFFNQARKRDWAKLTCQSCGVPLLAAKFSKRSNILFAMVEV
jgi:hypothetical protein